MQDGGIDMEFGPEMRLQQCARIPVVDDSVVEPLFEIFRVGLRIPQSTDSAVVQLTSPVITTVRIVDDGE